MKTGEESKSRAHWCICVSWDWLKDLTYYIFPFYYRICFVVCPFPCRFKDIVSCGEIAGLQQQKLSWFQKGPE
jgi:hypothetical protein